MEKMWFLRVFFQITEMNAYGKYHIWDWDLCDV